MGVCTEAYFENRMRNVENKEMLKSKWLDCRALQKELANFYKSQNHILSLNSILPGQAEVGELQIAQQLCIL